MITNIVNRVLGKGGRRGTGMGTGRGRGMGRGASGTGAGTGGSTRDAAIGRGVRSLLRRVR